MLIYNLISYNIVCNTNTTTNANEIKALTRVESELFRIRRIVLNFQWFRACVKTKVFCLKLLIKLHANVFQLRTKHFVTALPWTALSLNKNVPAIVMLDSALSHTALSMTQPPAISLTRSELSHTAALSMTQPQVINSAQHDPSQSDQLDSVSAAPYNAQRCLSLFLFVNNMARLDYAKHILLFTKIKISFQFLEEEKNKPSFIEQKRSIWKQIKTTQPLYRFLG